jgi:capsular exopolysaccharide synthesis family protein
MSVLSDERKDRTRYVEAVREHWLFIFVLVALAVGTAATYSLTASKRYEAGVDVLVTPVANDEAFLGINVLRQASDPNRDVITAARLVKTHEVADGVRARLGSNLSRNELLGLIEVKPVGQANMIRIVASTGTARGAAVVANSFADALIDQRTEQFQAELQAAIARLRRSLRALPPSARSSGEAVAIQERLAGLSSLRGARDPTLTVVIRAVPPDSAVWPKTELSIGIAFLAALLLGIGLVVGLEMVNPRVKDEDELLFVQLLPILARVPLLRRKQARDYLAGRKPLPADAWEAYRTLRANLAAGTPENSFPRTILVTSAMAGDGKTMASVNLAITLAAAGVNVVLVDGDLRRPGVSTVFRVPSPQNGFVDLFMREAPDTPKLVSVDGYGEHLRLLLSSPVDADLVDFLEPRRVRWLLAQLEDEAEVVIIDSPAVTEVADALTLADAVEAVLIAVRLGHTRRDNLSELRRLLSQRGIAPLGFVVTTRQRARRYAYYRPTVPRTIGEPTSRESLRSSSA